MSATPSFLSVIVPAHDCAGPLSRCLPAIVASTLPRERWELIVVDDASEDDSAIVAAEFADLVIRLPASAHGPGYSRNRGVEASRGDLLVFVSADVCVRPDTLAQLVQPFADPAVGAVSGMYEHRAHGHPLTAYQGLYHEFIFRRAAGDVDAFFCGLGAIRRDALMRAGGFDEWRQDRPRVAARELGHRIRAAGYRVLLSADVRATHLRGRSFREMLRQTLRDHGIPYDEHEAPPAEAANEGLRWVRRRERLSPLLCWIAFVSLVLALARPHHAARWATCAVAALAVMVLNAPFLRFAIRKRGVLAIAWIAPLHFAGSMLMGVARYADRILRTIIGEPRPAPVIEAFVEVGFTTWPPIPRRSSQVVAPPGGR